MYQAKTTGFLELLMNALALPTVRRASTGRRASRAPRRHAFAVGQPAQESNLGTQIYFEAARLSRWNR